jgi:type VI secretion system protein ImpL
VKRAYSSKEEGLRLDQAIGLDVEKVFKRKSGPWSTPMSRLYTPAVFKQITTEGQAVLVKRLSEDAWIWGEGAASSITVAGPLVSAVFANYEQDYINAWDAFLDDIEFTPFTTIPQTTEALRILTAPSSPLRTMLRVVADNTTLASTAAPKEPQGTVETAKQKLADAFKPFQSAAGLPTMPQGMVVTTHFQWVRQLTAGAPGQSQLDGVINTLAEILKQLDALGPDIAGLTPLETLSSQQFRTLRQTLDQQANVLPGAFRDLVRGVLDFSGPIRRGATKIIEDLYDTVVKTCHGLIDGRYPFAAAQPEVQVAAFNDLFGYGGVYDKFFTEQISKYVDASQLPWTWRPGSIETTRPILPQVQEALRVRDLFFAPGSKSAEVRYAVTISDLDATTTRFVLTVDGQIYDGRPGPPLRRSGWWPGPMNGQALAQFEGRFYNPPTPYGGAWAWFRMVDATAEGPPEAQQQVRLKVFSGSQSARVLLEGARENNPFASGSWRQFSCGS